MTTFDATTHTYRIDGKVVPSVTQVLSDLIPGWQASEWYLQRGTAVHACAAMIARGVEFDHDPAIDGQVRACKRFFAEVKPDVCAVEKQVFSEKHGYAGTLDLLAKVGKEFVLIDWKASVTPSLPYQLAAYAEASDGRPVWRGCGVEIRPDGTYRMTKVYDLRNYRNGFLALLSAYKIRRACKVKEEGIKE